jgi:SAM-dependent methyltransferase
MPKVTLDNLEQLDAYPTATRSCSCQLPKRPRDPLTGFEYPCAVDGHISELERLRGVRKALRASPGRRTRFHTERGRMMPLSAWARLPKSVLRRLRGRDEETPWMVPAAVSWLASQIRPQWRVLELGGGRSTTWYAERVSEVLCFEHCPAWHDFTRNRLIASNESNWDLRLTELDRIPDALRTLNPSSFDLVSVDCNESDTFTRVDAIRATHRLVKPEGYLLLDDSDVPRFRSVDRILDGWAVKRFVGVKPFPLMAVETSVFQRPAWD